MGAARRELARDNGARFRLPDTATSVTKSGPAGSVVLLPVGACFWYMRQVHLWWIGKISAHIPTAGQYVVCSLDDPKQVKLGFSSARYTTALGAVGGSCYLQVHQRSSLMRDIVRNVRESRGAELVCSTDLDTSP